MLAAFIASSQSCAGQTLNRLVFYFHVVKPSGPGQLSSRVWPGLCPWSAWVQGNETALREGGSRVVGLCMLVWLVTAFPT